MNANIIAGALGRGGTGLRGVDRGVARLHHGVERAPLVSGVAAHRFDQVGDQVAAALELHVDLRPGGAHLVALADKLVVGRQGPDEEQDQHQADGSTDDAEDHGAEPPA